MPQDDIAVEVKNLYKTFKIPLDKVSGIKQLLIKVTKRRKQAYREFNVLQDINFDIKKGEFFGIVGRNGSGKSTLLKLIAGIYTPGKGSVRVEGTLTPFIELGVGFNPELTGRENIYLNGALLGFSRTEMAEMYDEIVDFSELSEFMEERLKNYSSGMQVRLAFAIAVRAKSDVLLIDEVLAVGDSAFQQKCFDYFDQLKREKRTIVFISHDMSAVKKYCDRCIVVNEGKIIADGTPEKAAKIYDKLNLDKIADNADENQKKKVKPLINITTLNSQSKPTNKFNYLDEIKIKLKWDKEEVKNVGVTLFKGNEYIFGTNTFGQKSIGEDNSVELNLKLNLGSGKYRIGAGLFGDTEAESLLYIPDGPEFIVDNQSELNEWGGLTRLENKWN
jgi:ABC-2 type transport system ATP-binding protein